MNEEWEKYRYILTNRHNYNYKYSTISICIWTERSKLLWSEWKRWMEVLVSDEMEYKLPNSLITLPISSVILRGVDKVALITVEFKVLSGGPGLSVKHTNDTRK